MRSAVLLLVAACSSADDVPAPTIASIVPERGPPGATVTITGDWFCQQPEHDEENPFECARTGAVLFGAVPGIVGVYVDTMITVEVPELPASSVDVVVSVGERRSNAVTFAVE